MVLHQMIYFPETIIQWNTILAMDMLHYCWPMHNDTYSVHDRSLKVVVELSSSFSAISLRLLSSPVQTQLMLIVSHWGPGAPHPQDGVPSPRVRVHSLPRVQNKYYCTYIMLWLTMWHTVHEHTCTYIYPKATNLSDLMRQIYMSTAVWSLVRSLVYLIII